MILMIALAAAGAGGCQSGPAMPQPLGASVLTLDPEARRTTARVNLGHELTIELPPLQEPGHAWGIMSADVRFVRQMSRIAADAATGRPKVRFLMLQTGRTVIRFLALPEDRATGADPVGSHEVVLTIE